MNNGQQSKQDSEKVEEKRGKSWRREREDRGKKQQNNQPVSTATGAIKDLTSVTEHRNSVVSADSDSSSRRESVSEGGDRNSVTSEMGRELTPESGQESCNTDINTGSTSVETSHNVMDDSEVSSAIEEQEKKMLQERLSEMKEKLEEKKELRKINKNAAANRPEESFFSKLDSSLRKNTAFVKKVKTLSDAQRDSLVREMNGLNLTRYIGEVADAVVEAKLKMSDMAAAVEICSLLHQRYSEFSVMLLEKWHKILTFKKEDKINNLSKMRVDLRFYAELISAGVFTHKEGLPLLGNLLTTLINMDKEEHNNLSIILSFCKHCGEDYCGLVPRKTRLLAEKHGYEIPKSDMLNPERQKNVRSLLKEYYTSLCKHLMKSHKDMQSIKRQNRRILQTKGELSSERRDKCEAAENAYQKLLSNTQQFADTLDEDMPLLPQDESSESDPDLNSNIDIHNRFKNREFQFDSETSLWEDEDTRSFYENLPDLKSFIPAILFKDSVRPATPTGDAGDKIIDDAELEDSEGIDAELGIKLSEDDKIELEDKKVEDVVAPDIEDVEDEPEVTGSTAGKILLESFLISLLHCVNRELIDKAAVEFCLNLNTKPNRKKLVKTLFLVPRTRLDLLPFFARFVATLNPCMPDVAIDLASMLKQDFRHHVYKKDQINIESKVKTVRFIGELVKFKMYAKSEALFCLKMLLADFSHHHIEMTCNLLETCGRFLFRSPESHQRTKVYLDQMMRKKAVMALDSRYVTMIENAFYYCNPPEIQQSVKKERPPMHEYIRKLLYKDLGKNNTEKVLRQMRKLNWDDQDVAGYATKCLSAIWNVKYYNIRCVANLLAGLVAHKEHVGPHVVDAVLEEIRLGMEINSAKFNQRRVSVVRYLGELYNYRMVESAVIFRVLYLFVTFGVAYEGTQMELDPPDNLFRIRLICILLDTCGQYFNSGSSKKKLDYFLTYFQRYFWLKRGNEVWNDENIFPVTVDFMVKDTISTLRVKLKMVESYEDAQKAVESLEEELRKRLMDLLPSLRLKGEEAKEHHGDGLETVPETDEDDAVDDDDLSPAASDLEADADEDMELAGDSQSQPMDIEDLDMDGEDGREETTGNSQPADSDDVRCYPGGPKHLTCPEDDDFMAAFDKMMAENIQHRSQENVKAPQVEIPVPVNVKSNVKKTVTIQRGYDADMPIEEKNTINFFLMMRKGNKQQYKSLEVPVCSELALNLRDREEAERAEKERVKRLTLDINERQEEEDYQEMLAAQQRPAVMNLNRERRQKYQHPKGAPDADLIFGNKKR